MSFLTQIAVLLIVLVILIIIIKSNQTLEQIYMEGEKEPAVMEIPLPKINFTEINFPKRKRKEEEEEKEPERKEEKKPVERAGGTVPAFVPTGWHVEILDDYGREKERRKISAFPFSIGRNEENDLVLDDLSVSSFHATVKEENGTLEMEDAGSLNKLYARGTLTTHLIVDDRMEVGLGNIRLRFCKENKKTGSTISYEKNSYIEEWL